MTTAKQPGNNSVHAPSVDTRPVRRRPTINDIARLAGVSKKTVSRVINRSPLVRDETRQVVDKIIAELGFTPDLQARALAFGRSFLIGLIYDNPNPQYVIDTQQGILDMLDGVGLELVVRPCRRGHPEFYDRVRDFVDRQRLAGVILTPSVSEDERVVSTLRALSCPLVRIASVLLDRPESSVVTHDAEGAEAAARHLAALGHIRIAHISGPADFRSAAERRAGFRRGLAAAGVAVEPRLDAHAAYTYDSGLEAGRSLLRMRKPPTAVFCGNDEMAAGLYQAAREAGLEIGRELAIIGFDDSPIASRLWPALTSVRLPIRAMGGAATRQLLAQIAGVGEPDAEPRVVAEFRPKLVVRSSTDPAL
jgi:LacI family transcriptional regulator